MRNPLSKTATDLINLPAIPVLTALLGQIKHWAPKSLFKPCLAVPNLNAGIHTSCFVMYLVSRKMQKEHRYHEHPVQVQECCQSTASGESRTALAAVFPSQSWLDMTEQYPMGWSPHNSNSAVCLKTCNNPISLPSPYKFLLLPFPTSLPPSLPPSPFFCRSHELQVPSSHMVRI